MPPLTVDPVLVERARDGDRRALGEVLEGLRPVVHRLAVSMLWDRNDAEDATQEILIKVMTSLGSWRGEAAVTTWAYRIAVRHLAQRRRSLVEQANLSFDDYAADLVDGLRDSDRPDADLLADEVRVGCTLAMLQCLDRRDRIIFVLGEVLRLPGEEAAEIVDLSHNAYRQRLSRSRAAIREFVAVHCGLVNARAPCRCRNRVEPALRADRIDPGDLRFARTTAVTIQRIHDAAALMRALPDLAGDPAIVTRLMAALP